MLFFQFCIPCTGPVFCLLLGVSSGCARPITGQATSSQNAENSPPYSPWRNNAENSPHYSWDAENWECRDVLNAISVLGMKCGYNAEISPHSCPNTPIHIFAVFPPHYFPHFFFI